MSAAVALRLSALFLLAAVLAAACADGDSATQSLVDEALLRGSDLPGEGWSNAASGPEASATVFELTDFLGLSAESLRASPACAPYRDRIEDSLIEFAHISTTGSGAAAWRSGTLPLSQILVTHAIAAYDGPRRAEQAAETLAAVFADPDAATCLNDVAANVVEGLASAQVAAVAPQLLLENARGYAFRIEALVLILLVSTEIEAQIAVRDNVLSLYLVVDFNTRFMERDAQTLVTRLADRLRDLLPG